MTTHLIPMVPAPAARTENYGITHLSQFVYHTTGKGLHNRSFPHRIVVWDNEIRPRNDNAESNQYRPQHHLRHLDGAYIDPSGRPTDDLVTVLLDAESMAITNSGTNTGTVASGQVYSHTGPLMVDDFVVLVWPSGDLSAPYRVTARSLADPELVPIANLLAAASAAKVA
jgi:hypothetical protein